MHAELEQRLRHCRNLPSLPAVAVRIIDLAQDPEAGLGEVAETIAQDPALATKLLRVANSSLYARRRHSDNLRQALNLLGLDAALTLALGFSLRTSSPRQQKADTDMAGYWRRSLLAATACRVIAQQRRFQHVQEELFLAGLLQSIGKLVLERMMPEEYRLLLAQAQDQAQLIDLERQHLGADHAEVGAWLLRCWRLPEYLQWAVAASHDPDALDIPQAHRAMAYCVAASGRLADVWLSPGDPKTAERAVGAARRWLGMDEAGYHAVLEAMGELLPTISSLFEFEVVETVQIAGILDEAKELLTVRNLQLLGHSHTLQQRVLELEQRTGQLEAQSHLDPLTGLYNRRYLEERLGREFATATERGWPLGLAFLDLDHFKAINDTYGHPVGDQVLMTVARRLAHHIRQSDLLARFGGEEFVILLPGTRQAAARALLERLVERVREQTVNVDGQQSLTVTVSIGLATHPDDGPFVRAENLLRAADQALYAAKRAGRDRLAVYENLS